MGNNMTKIENGIEFNGIEYLFQKYIIDDEGTEVEYEILNELQCHIGTDKGVLLFDTSITIDNTLFQTSQEFIDYIYL
jgi:hypothetical protein